MSDNRIDFNGCAMTQWGLNQTREILKQHGSVEVSGVPGFEKAQIFYDEATLIDWAVKLMMVDPKDATAPQLNPITFAVAAWRTNPQDILDDIKGQIDSLLAGRMTGAFVVEVSDPPLPPT